MRTIATGLLAFALASCGGDAPSDVEEGTASGQVLPGSISDDMIALDQVRGEAELDPTGESIPGGDSEDSGDAAEPGDAEASEPEAPAVAPEPAANTPPPAPTQQPGPAKASPKAAPPPPVSVLPSKKTDED